MSELQATLYTGVDLSQTLAMSRMWRLLCTAAVGATKFDSIEKTRLLVRPDSFVEAAALLGRDRQLFVRGSPSRFLASFTDNWSGSRVWDFTWRTSAGATEMEVWISWLSELCSAFPPLFGGMCTRDEYTAKHAMLDRTGKPSMLEGSVGEGTSQLRLALPGIYWWTVFGPEAAADLGLPQCAVGLDVKPTVHAGGSVSLRLNEAVVPTQMEERLKTEQVVALALGERHFFDRTKPRDTVHLPLPSLVTRLDELAAAKQRQLRPGQ